MSGKRCLLDNQVETGGYTGGSESGPATDTSLGVVDATSLRHLSKGRHAISGAR